ncbi:MAG: hypothetical protein AB8B92_09830, partial [Gammaproteobacteria bacterium]
HKKINTQTCKTIKIFELSFRNIVEHSEIKDVYLAKYISDSSRIRQFVMAQSKFLVKVAKLPAEFETGISVIFDELKEKI